MASTGPQPMMRQATVTMLMLWCCLCVTSHAFAQTLSVQAPDSRTPTAQAHLSPGPYFVGVPVQLQLSIAGFEETPDPTVEVDSVDGVKLRLVAVSPRVSSSVHITNGKVQRWKEIRHSIRYEMTATRPGEFVVGPFTITQGSTRVEVGQATFRVGDVPSSETQLFKVVLPKRTLWVGERIPVAVEWWISREMGQNIAGRRARVPLFDQLDRLRFEDREDAQARASLDIDLESGAKEFSATLREDQHNGNPYFVVTVNREMTPLSAGRIDLPPASIVVQEATRVRQNVFGERIPVEVRRTKAESEPISLDIREPPTSGRPVSFAGVVGTGFSIAASVERSVVNVGDPITIRITVRGDGPLDTLALPDAVNLGLEPSDFKVAGGQATGTLTAEGSKQFNLTVRPLLTTVTAVPELTISWFDAEKGHFESARSDPIALSVRAAEVVGSESVVVNRPKEDADSTTSARSPRPSPGTSSAASSGQSKHSSTPVQSRRSDVNDLSRFSDVSITTDIATLTAERSHFLASPMAQVVGYGACVLLIACGYWWRARRARDPQSVSVLQRLRAERAALKRAATAADVSATVRAAFALRPLSQARTAYDALLAECDAIAYGRDGVDARSLERLRAAADEIIGRAIEDVTQ